LAVFFGVSPPRNNTDDADEKGARMIQYFVMGEPEKSYKLRPERARTRPGK
jgi:hypothetical protein